jgi:glycosyltransferase involved in cell wall biosynthesis
MQAYRPLVSIIIPTRNESEDIARTLETVLDIAYQPKEIIVVDDSNDDTPQIVSRYTDCGVRLMQRRHNSNGCCGARNLGMKKAQGEIVILLNADALPERDFIDQILLHYQAGADYLIVHSVVKNRQNLWGKYIFVCGEKYYSGQPDMEWSEGFSCRRAAAEQVGFIPGDYPIPFCRDYRLGLSLKRAGFEKHVDLGIRVEHIAPGSFDSYWRNQVWRGTFSAPTAFFMQNKPKALVAIRECAKLARTVLYYLLLVPALWRIAALVPYAQRRWRDFPGLFYVGAVQSLATVVGNFRGLRRVLRYQPDEGRLEV